MKLINEYRIVYMGTPRFSAQVLETMIQDGFNIVGVIAQEDKPVGRKKELEPVPTKQVAQAHNIPVFQPHRIRKDFEFVKDLKPDLILSMAYGQIIPHELIVLPKYGCLNLHASLLPSYRGAAPIQRAIMNGDQQTGVTLMEMVDEMDAGKMYAKETCPITDEDTMTSMQQKIVECSVKLIRDNLIAYLNGELEGEEQNEDEVTFANKIHSEDEHVHLEMCVNEFIRYVHALSEMPGAYVIVDGKKLKLYHVEPYSDDVKYKTGQLIIKKGTFIQLNNGIIKVNQLQLEGKKKTDGVSFANGNAKLDKKILQ